MSARRCSLKKIEDLDEDGIRNFLKSNGMSPCLKVFQLEKINGKTFLNLSKSDFAKWRKLTFESEIKVIEAFLKDVKENPEKYIKEEIQSKPTPERKSIFYVNLKPPDAAGQQKTTFPLRSRRSSPKRTPLFSRDAKYSQSPKQTRFLDELDGKLIWRKRAKDENTNISEQNEQEEISTHPNIIQFRQKEESKLETNEINSAIEDVISQPIRNQEEHFDKPVDVNASHYSAPKSEKPTSNLIESKYYLNFNRNEAEVYLKITATDGSYLFRPSSRHFCALSVLSENEVYHVGVNCVEKSKLELVLGSNNLHFDSLDDIVEYFRENPVQAAVQKNIKLIRHIAKNKEM